MISVPAAHLTAYWNFPQISWAANSFELSDKSLFKTFVRSTGPLSEVGKSLVVLFKTYQWDRIGLLYIDEGSVLICSLERE
ncbi:Metabotropic glutamate receptor 5 [Mactra antiquata]